MSVLRNITKRKNHAQQTGLTLIEALVAMAIMSVGFVGVYTLVGYSAKSMSDSLARQKLQMQANQILDVIESDFANIDQYVLDLTMCNPPGMGETMKYQVRPYEWCQRINAEVGAPQAGDVRSVDVTTLMDGRKVVHVLLETQNGNIQIVMKRIYDQ